VTVGAPELGACSLLGASSRLSRGRMAHFQPVGEKNHLLLGSQLHDASHAFRVLYCDENQNSFRVYTEKTATNPSLFCNGYAKSKMLDDVLLFVACSGNAPPPVFSALSQDTHALQMHAYLSASSSHAGPALGRQPALL